MHKASLSHNHSRLGKRLTGSFGYVRTERRKFSFSRISRTSVDLVELVEHQEVCTGLSPLPGSLLLDALQNTHL